MSENETKPTENKDNTPVAATETTKPVEDTETATVAVTESEEPAINPENATVAATELVEAEMTTASASMSEETSNNSSLKNKKGYIAAILVVAFIILGVLYSLEKEGRSATNIFGSIIASQEAKSVVAVVNGKKIINSDLTTSIQQFSQAAAAQGVDVTSPDAQAGIRTQALDVLINTELLKQAASGKGITVDDETADARLQTIETDIGGKEVLAERMEALGITQEKLESDIKDEIMIQQLLEIIFKEAEITVTEEEVIKVYEDAGGSKAGLPPLEEVRPQVEAQIQSTKEQEAIDKYLGELKSEAEIETK